MSVVKVNFVCLSESESAPTFGNFDMNGYDECVNSSVENTETNHFLQIFY